MNAENHPEDYEGRCMYRYPEGTGGTWRFSRGEFR